MRGERRDPLLGPSLALSVSIHALVIVPLLAATLSADGPRGVGALFEPSGDPGTPPPAAEPESPLGIDRSEAVSLSWVGYEEYQEHLAKLAETDQAAFTDDDAGGQAGREGESRRPEGAAAAEASAASSPSAAAAASGGAVPRGPESPDPAAAAATLPEATQTAIAGAETSPAGDPNREDTPPPVPAPAPAETPAPAPPQPQTPVPSENPQPQQPQESPPTPPASGDPAPAAPGPPRDAPPRSGDAAEKESDAFSAVDVPPEQWRNGKPLAMKGLEIQPRRPSLPLLTQLTTRPRHPVVELRFNSRGRVERATLLSSTGFEQVDGPILDSLYRWTARGEVLASLREGQLAVYRLRLILRE